MLDNPYTYTEWDAGSAQWKRESDGGDRVSTTAVGGRERLAEIVPDALAALHEVLERHRVTEDEWHAVLRFLTDVGTADEFILLSDVTRTSVLIDAMSHAGDDERDGERRRGPALPGGPAVARGAGARSTRTTRAWATARCSSCAAASPRPTARRCPTRCIDIWQTGPERRLRHLGRAPARLQLPRPLRRRRRRARTSSRRWSRSPTRSRPRVPSGATWRRSASIRGARRTSTSR